MIATAITRRSPTPDVLDRYPSAPRPLCHRYYRARCASGGWQPGEVAAAALGGDELARHSAHGGATFRPLRSVVSEAQGHQSAERVR